MRTGDEARCRILWITERYPHLPGGMAESAERQVSGLRQAELVVDVLFLYLREGNLSVGTEDRDGGTDIHVAYPFGVGDVAQTAWQQVHQRHLESPYSAMVGFGVNLPGHLATTYAAWLELPSLALVRGNDFDRDWFDPTRHSMVNAALGRASIVGAVTLEKVEKIRALFPDQRVEWTPNGIDAEAWKSLPGEHAEFAAMRTELAANGRRVIGLFGDLKYKKRVPFWLEAVREAGLLKKIGILVVGRMDEPTHRIFNDPELAPLHRHFPFRSRDDLPGLYAVCDFVAVPSMFEGFPNVLLEAMACQLIPITSSAGAMRDLIVHGENGFVFPAEDRGVAAQATAAALALSNRELVTMKERCREFVMREFPLDRECGVLLELIAQATGDR